MSYAGKRFAQAITVANIVLKKLILLLRCGQVVLYLIEAPSHRVKTYKIYRLKVLCTEIYKSLNSLSPLYIKDIFKRNITNRPVRAQQQENLKAPQPNQTTFGTKSLTSLGYKIWNSLPGHIKCSENLANFKKVIKHWNGEKCTCRGCKKF